MRRTAGSRQHRAAAAFRSRPPQTLAQLAGDPDVAVRLAVAANPSTPGRIWPLAPGGVIVAPPPPLVL